MRERQVPSGDSGEPEEARGARSAVCCSSCRTRGEGLAASYRKLGGRGGAKDPSVFGRMEPCAICDHVEGSFKLAGKFFGGFDMDRTPVVGFFYSTAAGRDWYRYPAI